MGLIKMLLVRFFVTGGAVRAGVNWSIIVYIVATMLEKDSNIFISKLKRIFLKRCNRSHGWPHFNTHGPQDPRMRLNHGFAPEHFST